MNARKVLRMGDARLSAVSKPVENPFSSTIQQIIQEMYATVRHLHGAGIAAPQLGYGYRIILFGLATPRYAQSTTVPETLLINPVVTVIDSTEDFAFEGCLSVPGIRGVVPRFTRILYSGYDAQGNRIEREASGFHARVVQHEYDHLNGILFPARVRDFAQFGFEDELGFTPAAQPALPLQPIYQTEPV